MHAPVARRLVTAALVLTWTTAFAGGMEPPPNYVAGYVRLDGVPGTSRSKPGWVEVSSLSVACDARRMVRFTHRVDESSQALRQSVARGKHFATGNVDLSITRYALTDVVVVLVQPEPVTASGVVRETVTLNFAKCATQ